MTLLPGSVAMVTRRRSLDPRQLSIRARVALTGVAVLVVVALVLSSLDSRGILDGTKDPLALRPGDCITSTSGGVGPSDVPVVGCDEPHDGEVVGLLRASAGRSDRSPFELCLDALDAYADPELLALTRVDPAVALRAVAVRAPRTFDDEWRCVLDLRDSEAEPRSLRR